MIAAAGDVADPERAGRGAGQFGFTCFLIAMGGSYLRQTGKKRLGLALWGFVSAAIVAVVVFAATYSPSSTNLDDIDRAPLVELVEGEQRVLRHLTHGFGFPHPGEGFALLTGPDAERVEEAMSEYPELHTFVFRNEATQDVFLVIMANH